MKSVYLDNAATSCLRKEVLDKMTESLDHCYGNPSSTHEHGRRAKSAIESARKTIARLIGASTGEIIFTSGGTEADNMIIQGAVQYLGVRHIITSKIEHHAVLHATKKMQELSGVQVYFVALTDDGSIDINDLENILKKTTEKTLVSLMHINNEIGNRTDIATVGNLCKTYGVLFHSDTVQSIGHREWNVKEQPIDFIVGAAHKFHGPKGVGFAYIRKHTGLKSLICGGGQERGMRAGTEAVHNIVGLEQAMISACETMEEESSLITTLKYYFIDSLKNNFPNIVFNGACEDKDSSSYNLINACFIDCPKEKALMLHFHLDIKGIACSKGSACQSGSTKGSHVLNEILPPDLLDKPSIRFSISIYNTKEDIDYTVEVLREYMLG